METNNSIEQGNTKIPRPIIYSLIFIVIGIVSAVMSIINPFLIIGNIALKGFPVILYSLIIGILLSICFYGIITKKHWALKTTIIWYSINILILFFNFVVFVKNIPTIIKLKQENDIANAKLYTEDNISFTAYITFLLGVVFAIYIIVNLSRNKSYFNK